MEAITAQSTLLTLAAAGLVGVGTSSALIDVTVCCWLMRLGMGEWPWMVARGNSSVLGRVRHERQQHCHVTDVTAVSTEAWRAAARR
ncbi:hypothetical protein DE146DRAFT_663136 [Phaeosphaeria sp. MPI-PUGE-AT-0046c]|nr:hypothetical protein DE146DRAFT_663136 [Phaeosphaeria sp. MPI-PUGE-AT-0046c]